MAAQLSTFLIGLGKDPAKLADFKNDPNAAMNAAGLSDVEKDIIKSGDATKISAAIDPQPNAIIVVVVVIIK